MVVMIFIFGQVCMQLCGNSPSSPALGAEVAAVAGQKAPTEIWAEFAPSPPLDITNRHLAISLAMVLS